MAAPKAAYKWLLNKVHPKVQPKEPAKEIPRIPEPPLPPASPTSDWLRSPTMFAPTLTQTMPHPITSPLITSPLNPHYLPTLVLLYNQHLYLEKVLNVFFGPSNRICRRIPEWMPRAVDSIKKVKTTRDKFGDLGKGKRCFGVWKEVQVLLKRLEEMLVDVGKIGSEGSFWAEHGFVRDVWGEDVKGGMDVVLEGLRKELVGAGWKETKG